MSRRGLMGLRLDRKPYAEIADGLAGLHARQVRMGRRFLPNFIIIGAAKSATTTLATVLSSHADIYISRPKEPKFFGRHYGKGWSWYRSIFRAGCGFALRGEASTMYASSLREFRDAPGLMHRYFPGMKIVYVVRHPLDRLVSQWRHVKGRCPDYVEFERILFDRRAARLLIGCSSYYERINAYRRYFPDQQIHCLTFEDLIADPAVALGKLLAFLGLPPQAQSILEAGNLPRLNKVGEKGRAHVSKPDWPSPMRASVIQRLRPDAEAFLAYIGKPKDYWNW